MLSQALLKITGLVQGVAYRAYARREAENLNLTGYAKNLDDGNVEILLQGEESKINEFIEWAKRGPSSAEVKNVEIIRQTPSPKTEKFDII